MTSTELKPEVCNCLALRRAARVVTQFYDQHLAGRGLSPSMVVAGETL